LETVAFETLPRPRHRQKDQFGHHQIEAAEINAHAKQWGISRVELFRRCLSDIPAAMLAHHARKQDEMVRYLSRKGLLKQVVDGFDRKNGWENDISGLDLRKKANKQS